MIRKILIFKSILLILLFSASILSAQPPGHSKGKKEGWSGSTPPGHSKSGTHKNKYKDLDKITDGFDEESDKKGNSGKKDKDKDTELEKATKKAGKKLIKDLSK